MKIKDQILEILKNSDGHMTAEEMYLNCKKNGVKSSLASTYRVLGELAKQGQIRKVSMPGQPDIFDKTLNEHEHIVCVNCGKVKDIKIAGLKETLAKNINNEFDSYDLCVRYICPDCKKKLKK